MQTLSNKAKNMEIRNKAVGKGGWSYGEQGETSLSGNNTVDNEQ